MADVDACNKALQRLAGSLTDLDPALRARHVPNRTVSCTVSDLDVVFVGRVDEHGVHDLKRSRDGAAADVKVSVTSDDLVALADGREDMVHAWLKGKLQVSAPMRDILRLRSVLGL